MDNQIEAGTSQWSLFLERLGAIFRAQEATVFLVGGAVRDLLLGRASHDLDFALEKRAINLAYRVADELDAPAYVLDRERDIGRVVLPDEGITLDFSKFRERDLVADLVARDFTINAMAIPAIEPNVNNLIDPLGGRQDLNEKIIRQATKGALDSDPVRALRAIRLAAELNFSIEHETQSAIKHAARLLSRVSKERIRDELLKNLMVDNPGRALESMYRYGLLEECLPELVALAEVDQSRPHHEPVLAHTLRVLDKLVQVERIFRGQVPSHVNAPATFLFERLGGHSTDISKHLDRHVDGGLNGWAISRLGALFHDVGKKDTRSIEKDGRIRFLAHETVGSGIAYKALKRLRFSNDARHQVGSIVSGHMRPHWLSHDGVPGRRAVYRFFRDHGPNGVDICLVALADYWAMRNPEDTGLEFHESWEELVAVIDRLLTHYFHHYKETIAPPPLISGRELIDSMGVEPGPDIGRLLRLVEEAQAAGEITNKTEALELASRSL